MSGAIITHVQLAAAHDGVAELIVTLRFDNGGQSLITLDEYAARILLENSGVEAPEALVGTSWEHVRDALATASNRYQETEIL